MTREHSNDCARMWRLHTTYLSTCGRAMLVNPLLLDAFPNCHKQWKEQIEWPSKIDPRLAAHLHLVWKGVKMITTKWENQISHSKVDFQSSSRPSKKSSQCLSFKNRTEDTCGRGRSFSVSFPFTNVMPWSLFSCQYYLLTNLTV